MERCEGVCSQTDMKESIAEMPGEVTSFKPYRAKKNPKQWLQGKVVKWVTERKRLLTSRKGERVSMWRTSAVVPMSTSKTQRSESVPLTPQLQLKSPRVGRLIKAASVPPPAPEKRQKHLRQGGRRSQHRRNFFSGRHCEGQNLCSQFKMLSFDSVCTATSDGQDSSLTVGELLQEDVSFFSSSSSDADIIRTLYELGDDGNHVASDAESEGTLSRSLNKDSA